MELRHYSSKPIKAAKSVEQIDASPAHKPCGLWVSAHSYEDNWRDWCEAEQFGIGDLEYVIELTPGANVLHISSTVALDAFHEKYKKPFELISWDDYELIDWARVAAEYQGIIIAPYQWSRRLDGPVHNWYYGWDCASGCIWCADAISSIRPTPGKE